MMKMWYLDLPHKHSWINLNKHTTQLFLNNGTYTYTHKMYNTDIKHAYHLNIISGKDTDFEVESIFTICLCGSNGGKTGDGLQ
jgi:hypothetical protein